MTIACHFIVSQYQSVRSDDTEAATLRTTTLPSSRADLAGFREKVGQALHERVMHELSDVIRRHGDVVVICTSNVTTVTRDAHFGFPMTIATGSGRCAIRLGEWEDEFLDVREVVSMIDDALRGAIRLRVTYYEHGSRWALERRLPDGRWIEQPSGKGEAELLAAGRCTGTIYLSNRRLFP